MLLVVVDVVDTQEAIEAAPLSVKVMLFPAPGRTVTDLDPAAKTTFEPFAISARKVCVPAVVA
jgi:DNA primase